MYPMCAKPRGRAVIINNEHFEEKKRKRGKNRKQPLGKMITATLFNNYPTSVRYNC